MRPSPTALLKRLRILFFLALATFLAVNAHGQLSVSMDIKRRTFMLHEPVLATVTLGNMSGHDIMLADTQEGGPWFSFQITTLEGRLISPRNARYELAPLSVKSGETLKRTVNLGELYALDDYGSYRVKASIYFSETGKYFASKFDHFDLSDGKSLWKQTVGVPEGLEGAGTYRQVELLTMQHERAKMLYVRITGVEDGITYCCYNLGNMLEGTIPDAKFDGQNNLTVLALIGPKTYSLSQISMNGALNNQGIYVTPKTQPYLRKTAEGAMQVVGARRQQAVAQTGEPMIVPKLSDRPPGF